MPNIEERKVETKLDYCLKCDICYTKCPIVSNDINFPGPKTLGPDVTRLGLLTEPTSDFDSTSLTYCLNCKRCDMACPHDVRPSHFILSNKYSAKIKLKDRFRDYILGNMYVWSKPAKLFAPITNKVLQLWIIRQILEWIGIAAKKRSFPSYQKGIIADTFSTRQKENVISDSVKNKGKKVLYFRGCYAKNFDANVAKSAVRVLESCGYQVENASLDCCGVPLFTNGFEKQSFKLAQKNTNYLLSYIKKGYCIVTTCPSCCLAFKQEYQEILGNEEAELLSRSVYDICELLEEEGVKIQTLPGEKIYYHVPCHLKAQGMGTVLQRLVEEKANLTVNEEYCCGMSGTYGFKKEKYKLSMEVGNNLFREIKDDDCYDTVITDCGTCKMQIYHGTGINTKHPIEIIDQILNQSERDTKVCNYHYGL